MEVKEIFVKRIQELIKEKNTTIYKIAKELKLNEKSLGNWVTGRNEPTITTLKILADYFGVCADFLLGRQDWE